MSDQSIMSYRDAEALIENVDTAVFNLPSETGPGDKRMLLACQNIIRRNKDAYVYAEIGSYMGGTLVPHLMDARCALVISIDKRPDQQPDERAVTFDYTRSSTALMIERLQGSLPESALLKLETHDCDAAVLPEVAHETKFDMGFIDGEHTNRAAFQDFLSFWRFAAKDCIIAFHDANLITDALANVESLLSYEGVRFNSLVLPDVVFAIFIGKYARFSGPLARHATDKETFFRQSKEALWNGIAKTRRPGAT
jgi:hypothetical protein